MNYLGTSGWYYDHWASRFYPTGLSKGDWLPYYCTRFNTVEVNASFYRLPSKAMVAGWRTKTPEDFVFSFKGSRLVTHQRKLKGTTEDLTRFYTRIRNIGEKLGVILWQLPPSLQKDLPLLESFLADLDPGLRQAIEFRHASWLTPETYGLLERYQVGLCIVSSPTLPVVMKTTTSFAYLRWHGGTLLYATNYRNDEIKAWAASITRLPVDDVYGYFNNDAFAYAPKNCLELKAVLKQQTQADYTENQETNGKSHPF